MWNKVNAIRILQNSTGKPRWEYLGREGGKQREAECLSLEGATRYKAMVFLRPSVTLYFCRNSSVSSFSTSNTRRFSVASSA